MINSADSKPDTSLFLSFVPEPVRRILLLSVLVLLPGFLFSEIPDPLKVALIPNLFPVSFVNEEGAPDGAFPLVIARIAEENGIEIEWVQGTWDQSMGRIRTGEIDLMLALISTAERDSFLDFNQEPVLSSWSQVFQVEGPAIENIFDVEGKRVGLMRGDQNAAGFIQLATSFDVEYNPVYFDSFEEVSAALYSSTIDAGVFYSLYHLNEPDLVPTSIIYQPNNSYFAVPEGADPEILKLIDASLSNWKADRASFYYTDVISLLSPSSIETPVWVKGLIYGMVGLAAVALFFILALRRQVNFRTAELVTSQAAYRSTFLNSMVGIAQSGTDGTILMMNQSFSTFLGREIAELTYQSLYEFTHPEDRQEEQVLLKSLLAGETDSFRMTKKFIGADGETLWGSQSVSAVRGEENEIVYLVTLVEDITARMQAENKLGDLESRYIGLFQNSHQMTAVLDELGRLLEANETFKKTFGVSSGFDNYLGLTPESMDWLGPVVSLRLQEMVDECLSTGRTIRQTMSAEETEARRALDLTIKPVQDNHGSIRYCIVELHDISELMALTGSLERQVEERTQEIRLAQDRLVEAEKMASLGRLVAGVAHEINTPVGVAKTGVSYLFEQISELQHKFDDKDLTEEGFLSALSSFKDLALILDENLERAIKLIRDFKLTSADQSSNEIRNVNVNEYLSAVLHSVTPKLKKAGIVWNIDASDEEHCIHVGAINPIIVNLTINAIDHGFKDESGVIDITHRVIGGRQILTFHDDGCGIEEELMSKVFEPFFTTGRNKGMTGLGLNIVYNLVKDIMLGEITCESRIGEGTTFRIEYPDPECVNSSSVFTP